MSQVKRTQKFYPLEAVDLVLNGGCPTSDLHLNTDGSKNENEENCEGNKNTSETSEDSGEEGEDNLQVFSELQEADAICNEDFSFISDVSEILCPLSRRREANFSG